MCEELNKELERGRKNAKALVEHFKSMGNPAKGSIPIKTDEGQYSVSVEKQFPYDTDNIIDQFVEDLELEDLIKWGNFLACGIDTEYPRLMICTQTGKIN